MEEAEGISKGGRGGGGEEEEKEEEEGEEEELKQKLGAGSGVLPL